MEVGAVKQAFNNELILLKKKLNQAKIQIIHKLTRKAKTLTEKKAPEALKQKLQRKAESAVNEVLIIKKIKPKDLARFAVTHKGQLADHLNKPNVDQDKVCARLLLHKALQDKYKLIRTRFSSIPIEDLLMSREERKKLKKEAREKQKNKRKENELKANNVVNAEGVWDVEDVDMSNPVKEGSAIEQSGAEGDLDDENKVEPDSEDSIEEQNSDESTKELSENESDIASVTGEDNELNDVAPKSDEKSNDEGDISVEKAPTKIPKPKKSKNNQGKAIPETVLVNKPKLLPKVAKNLESKPKEKKANKNKNLNEKLLTRKFKKDSAEAPVNETKTVDPFFITSTGENYMSVVEPRAPDEVKEVHKQGNRKLRRAAMFGHVPNIKPTKNNFRDDDNRFNRNNGFNKNNSKRFNDNKDFSNDKRNFTDKRKRFNRDEEKEAKPEKLHPSWEAKKRQSGIQPFQGKKIVFDES